MTVCDKDQEKDQKKDQEKDQKKNKVGRPTFANRTNIKTRPMTIVLSQNTYNQLSECAKVQSRKKAEMARMIVESAVKNFCDGM